MFDLDFQSFEAAVKVKNELIEHIQKYGCLTVCEVYEYIGFCSCRDEKKDYYWKDELDIVDAWIGTCDEVTYKLELPDPTAPKKDIHTMTVGEWINFKQQAKSDAGKPRLTMVPQQIIWDIAEVREYGNKKYGDPDNWKTVEKQRYRDAAYRHFLAYLADPSGVDEESGISHLKHLACNIAFLCEMEKKE